MLGIFITGTDTGVGKTHTTCGLARALTRQGLCVGIYKPACSGGMLDSERQAWTWPDLDALGAALDGRFPQDLICPQTFAAPLAPPVAARAEGREVDAGLLRSGADRWHERVDLLLVEGVGGWKSPLTEDATVADLATQLQFPVLIVAANRLGMVNHTLLTLESLEKSGLTCLGVVVNCARPMEDESESSNASVLQQFTKAPVFGPLTWSPASETENAGFFDQLAHELRSLMARSA